MGGQFSNEDQVAIAFKTNQTVMVVCSTYMPYDSADPPPPKLMRDLTSFCEQKGWGLIIGANANSHNTTWGSSDTNLRGEELLDYIATTQLHVQNEGTTPTFRNRIREEVIDITLATNNVTNKIYKWKVSEEETFSDHNKITFSIKSKVEEQICNTRSIRKTNWIKYQETISSKLPPLEQFEHIDLEEMNRTMESVIKESFEE